jgi:hypothetical protein
LNSQSVDVEVEPDNVALGTVGVGELVSGEATGLDECVVDVVEGISPDLTDVYKMS